VNALLGVKYHIDLKIIESHFNLKDQHLDKMNVFKQVYFYM